MSQARDQRLFHLLQVSAHRLKTELDRATLDAGGLTAAQAGVLAVIARAEGLTQKEVAEQLRQQESAITAMAGRLIKAGLVDRTPHPTDGRAWRLTLTPEGAEALDAFRAPMDRFNAAITQAVGGEDEVAALAKALRALIEADLS
ncbi:MAG TPA: MarR family transcriptional regulator [Phenylobacterium sp.]|nr:MarR family transcriptional regulator [Phenylobacterium sp.]HQN50083.1 MarR family transcriptional regulator [Phenylobacterium sp.]HQP20542.1 MarR family transcriptional regulator [Phenylobacterium sp.]